MRVRAAFSLRRSAEACAVLVAAGVANVPAVIDRAMVLIGLATDAM